MLENMKGVIKVSVSKELQKEANDHKSSNMLRELDNLRKNIDLSAIDCNDNRTRHILRGSDLLKELEVI